MAYTRSAAAPQDFDFTDSPARPPHTFFTRLFAAMVQSRQRQVDREIARYLGGFHGKFTDEAEREIERRFLSKPPG
jgi:hypothetical protein